jgi:cytochrome c-type biogenesis protein CcmE
VDLSPRATLQAEPPLIDGVAPRKKRWPMFVLLALVLVGGGVIVTKFLTNALNYYCNVEEVNVKSNCDASHSLRVFGLVQKGTVVHDGASTRFTLVSATPDPTAGATPGGQSVRTLTASLPVVYEGEPGGLFNECVPVVIDGTLKDGVFIGRNLEVKHSNNYVAENKERIDQADQEATVCSSQV